MEGDCDHTHTDMQASAPIGVIVCSNSGDAALELSVLPLQGIHKSIAEAFSCKLRQLQAVEFGGEAVEEGATYEDYGVEVGRSSFVCMSWLALCCWLGTVLG